MNLNLYFIFFSFQKNIYINLTNIIFFIYFSPFKIYSELLKNKIKNIIF
jgi:hypothetical protein